MTPPVHVHMCSFPSREKCLPVAVKSLAAQLPRGGHIYLHLNEISPGDMPGWLRRLELDGKVTVTFCDTDLGDAGKVVSIGESRKKGAICLLCDDDFNYPPDFVAKLVAGVEKYKRKAVVGMHGEKFRRLPRGGKYTLVDLREVYMCMGDVYRDEPVHALGTGVMAFYSRLLPAEFSVHSMPVKNMADVWVAAMCQRLEIPMIVLAHRAKWLQLEKSFWDALESSIWYSSHHGTHSPRDTSDLQVATIMQLQPWAAYGADGSKAYMAEEGAPVQAKSVPTCRPSVSNLRAARQRVTVCNSNGGSDA